MDPSLLDIDGLLLSNAYPRQNLTFMRNMALRSDDIILITYPKCGTTWLSYIIWSILNPEEPAPEGTRVMTEFPFVDMVGLGYWADAPEDQSRTLITHMPYDWVPKCKSSKYVVVVRNPMDCCVSLYHFMKQIYDVKYADDEGQEVPTAFFNDFTSGYVLYGDYFKHLMSWYTHKDESNIHLVVFEKMKQHPRSEILKLAKFLGGDMKLQANDGRLLDKIVEQSSFRVMKQNVKYKHPMDKSVEVTLVRKGEAGGYRRALTQKQIEVLKEKMEKELKGTEILDYWRSV